MATGFANEKTAEHIVLHDLYEKYRNYYDYFYPFYFRKGRDDTKIALENNRGCYKLVAVFARRPKTTTIDPGRIIVTLRKSLFEGALFFEERGIPVFASSPIGSSIDDIGFGSQCRWFKICPNRAFNGLSLEREVGEKVDYEFFNDELVSEVDSRALPLDEASSLKILTDATEYNWEEIICLMHDWYDRMRYFGRWGAYGVPAEQRPAFLAYRIRESR